MTIILGIDPGSRITGYGLIREEQGRIAYLDSGCIRTTPLATLSQRLLQIFSGICELLETYEPTEVAIEELFLHKNVQSALKLGHARGAAMVAAATHQLKIHEYAPREIKQALVGYGGAQKSQVSHMVVQLLLLNKAPQVDAGDALAVAICHSHRKMGGLNLGRRAR